MELDNIIAFAPLKVIQRLDRFESYRKTSIELYPHIKAGSVKVIDVAKVGGRTPS